MRTTSLQEAEIRSSATHVDVRSVGRRRHGRHLSAELLEDSGRDRRVGAVPAVHRNPHACEVGTEILDNVGDVAVRGGVRHLDRAAAHGNEVEQRLDGLLVSVRELVALGVEELDPVVLRRVVGGRENDGKILGEERDGGRRQDTSKHGGAAGRDDSPHDRLLERWPRAARIAADEDSPLPRPCRGGTTQALHEVERERLADDPAHAIGSEMSTGHW